MRFESRRDRSPNEVPRALVKRWPWAQWLQWHQWLHRHRHRCHIDVMDVAFLWPCFHTYFPFASYLFHRHLLLDTKLFRIQVSMVFNLASMVSPIFNGLDGFNFVSDSLKGLYNYLPLWSRLTKVWVHSCCAWPARSSGEVAEHLSQGPADRV